MEKHLFFILTQAKKFSRGGDMVVWLISDLSDRFENCEFKYEFYSTVKADFNVSSFNEFPNMKMLPFSSQLLTELNKCPR